MYPIKQFQYWWLLFLAPILFSVAEKEDNPRVKLSLNKGWKYFIETGSPLRECKTEDGKDEFDIPLAGKDLCKGVSLRAYVYSAPDCRSECCNDPDCNVWQYGSDTRCYTGKVDDLTKDCPIHADGKIRYTGWARELKTKLSLEQFDDSKWSKTDIPHDYLIELNYTNSPSLKSHGYLDNTIPAWYRLKFSVSTDFKNKSVWIEFEGVFRNATVWLNNVLLGNHSSGYTPFEFKVDALLKSENVLAVYVNPSHAKSWWYEGAGIYRNVWLSATERIHVQPYGVYVPTRIDTESILRGGRDTATANATAFVQTSIENDNVSASMVTVSSMIFKKSIHIAEQHSTVMVTSNTVVTVNQTIKVDSISLWDVNHPHLYVLKTIVADADTSKTLDVIETTFGFRSLRWDKEKGLFLNERYVKIKGMANHQDFAGVGSAVPDSLQAYRVSMIKSMGANAWRTAHNPPAVALLDATDSLGVLVWDENHINTPDCAKEIEKMVKRDRNHPSIIIWSQCNEALCRNFNAANAHIGRQAFKKFDPMGGRPLSAAMNSFDHHDDFINELDMWGINYSPKNYDDFHKKRWPDKLIIGSETSSWVGDRGIYQDDSKNRKYVNAYDIHHPGWGASAEDAWCEIGKRDFMLGSFVWTGFDYRGEPTPYGWPNINSHFGIIDVAGFPKDNYYYYQSVWLEEKPLVHLLPHWNWTPRSCEKARGCYLHEKKNGSMAIDIWAYSTGDSVELFLNGKSLGIKELPVEPGTAGFRCRHVEWKAVPYQPGTITAIAYKQSDHEIENVYSVQYKRVLRKQRKQIHAKTTIKTVGKPHGIRLTVDYPANSQLNESLLALQGNIVLIRCEIVDEDGLLVPTANIKVNFSLEEDNNDSRAAFLGFGNGDPSCHESDKPSDKNHKKGIRSTFNGLARAIVIVKSQSLNFENDIVVSIHATAETLEDGILNFTTKH